MAAHLPVYEKSDVEVSERQRVYQGFFAVDKLTLRHRLYAGGWSKPFTRELFLRGRAAGVLLYDPQRDQLVLVEQFRVGILNAEQQSPWALELVAGMVDEGESAQEMAGREVLEETGLTIGQSQFICEYYNSPGGCDERISLFYAEVDSADAAGVHGLPEENEDIRVVVLPRMLAVAAMREGLINNAMAIIALQWLQIRMMESGAESA